MSRQCLYCYLPLNESEGDFHANCSKKFFGSTIPPEMPYDERKMEELAIQVIQTQTTVTGVQPKLSLHLESGVNANQPKRFTIVGLWGDYILKPPSQYYTHLPEVEDLTMHLASIAKIKVVPHSLIRLRSGSLAYITKRIDRKQKQKLHMEDMCQLTERLSEEKYNGSYEQIAKAIIKYSETPMLDVINFYELVLFSFITGNADMHLKNFSLIYQPLNGPVLSPAYDLVATALVNPSDNEELALTLNGKKRKITKMDFKAAFEKSNLNEKQQENIFSKMIKAKQKWDEMIHKSFLNNELKIQYKTLISNKIKQL